MSNVLQGVPVYDVEVDHSTLTLKNLARGGNGCSVQLAGSTDETWVETFQRERRESRALSRYEIDSSTGTVRFVREPGSDPADVMDALETLDTLVQRVNRLASRANR